MFNRSLPTSLIAKAVACLMMAGAADWLFYDRYAGWGRLVGVPLGIFCFVILGVLAFFNRDFLKSCSTAVLMIGCFSLIAAMVEDAGVLAIVLFLCFFATLMVLSKREKVDDALLWLADIGRMSVGTATQFYHDRTKIYKIRKSGGSGKDWKIGLIVRHTLLPVILAFLFCYLFALANPLIAETLDGIDFSSITGFFSLFRWVGWTFVIVFAWGLLRTRFKLATERDKPAQEVNLDAWFNRNSILVSLIVFNGIFAIQNILDFIFLWSGEPLPYGMTYAFYARAGAYPLIITALLAGGYVLLTFRENTRKYQSPAAKKWVLAWIAQNIILVLSSINRNLHYIETYSLTYLRLAALIWMSLVAAGFILIVIRIHFSKKNIWLINMNTVTLITTLYLCCFVNFGGIIAQYNVRHAKEVTGLNTGVFLDLEYMASIGTDALPALQWFEKNAPYSPEKAERARQLAFTLSVGLEAMNRDWRLWTWRGHRIEQQMKQPDIQKPIEDGGGWQSR